MLGHHWLQTTWGPLLTVFDLEEEEFVRIWLPDMTAKAQLSEARKIFAGTQLIDSPLPRQLRPWGERIERYFTGAKIDFKKIPLKFIHATSFQEEVYRALLEVPFGQTQTYGDIAHRLGTRGFQAIGSAVGRNPLPLVVPCHRILANKGPGGFSSNQGLQTKERLLAIEGVELYPKTSPSIFDHSFDLQAATKELAKSSPVLKAFIKRAPPFDPGKKRPEAPLRALAKSLVHQQLSTKAAATIWQRLCGLAGSELEKLPLLKISDLRSVGLSAAKAQALVELAQSKVGTIAEFKRMSDREVVQVISSYRGFGVWSAQMFLIFNLGRMDTFAPLDLGLQKGRERLFKVPFSKDVKELELWAQDFAPWRTLLSWYLWRSLED